MSDADLVQRVQSRFDLSPPDSAPVAERQCGAIPYAVVDGTPAFLLVTSRRSGRWIFPKGRMSDDLTPAQTAAREAFEEAGVEGDVEDLPIGSYRSWKIRGLRRSAIEIDMYPLLVIGQQDEWLEQGQRHRHWATWPEARRLITQRGLRELVMILDRRERSRIAEGA